ncbi:hypothetical protein [Pseudomonas sp. MWU13-3659]|uniref:hypothetical protein n=1 Tax=Pseudomonas sp. MWU13-3659 TaxID=2986964 RepID=UPI0020763418|nr:hypothetical protein [Pseudomonas sp. MWU13-3659]
MSKPRPSDEDILARAEQAIRDDIERDQLLEALWARLQVPDPHVSRTLFQHGEPSLNRQAEQELLNQVKRMQSADDGLFTGGTRPSRPLLLRGIVI